jgi:hypothetical protein
MIKALRKGEEPEECVQEAKVLQYDKEKECIFFLLEKGKLEKLSLDAIYECRIQNNKEQLDCTGRITERYCGISGKIFKFKIANGFYKINLK